GMATVTCGPGLTQIVTALPAAVRAHIPLIIFAGESPLKARWYNQAIEQKPFIEACGAEYRSLHETSTMLKSINQAFVDSQAQKKPIVLGIPLDLQEQPWKETPVYPSSKTATVEYRNALGSQADALSDIARKIRFSNKVVVMAGRGAVESGAGEICVKLADQNNALLATTLPARGLFREHAFNIGIAGGFSTDTARQCLQQADCIVAVGTRLAQHNSDGGKLFSADNVIHIDIEPRKFSQGREASNHQLESDAALGVHALIVEIDRQNSESSDAPPDTRSTNERWRSDKLAQEISLCPADSTVFDRTDSFLDPRDVVSTLDSVLPEDWTMVNSSGHCSYFFAQMPKRPVEHFVTIREFGAIGNGIAFAIGAAVARPDKPVVLFDGDGSLLMHIQEMETIVRHNLNILICVLNDGAYGSEIHKLRAHGLSDKGAVFGRSDFSKIAQGFDASGSVIEDLNDVDAALTRYKQQYGACIWDFHVTDEVISPVIRRSHH
ncbi:MAG: thiamine pyrophosphate-binding protein, partial [Gammaproteobacteria bacterium]|nr:thiamine pyrophosphate-binding protein [Gammaproteobacteria bacterium]